MPTYFISDLHLDVTRPSATVAFLRFLRDIAGNADALYILGDLFEAWVGDDDDSPLVTEIATALSGLSVDTFYMHGNRDFLLGEDYAARCGMQLLDDPTVIDLYGTPTLLMHGDLLCTDDLAYQAFREQTRDRQWQAQFLAQPLAARKAFAAQARAASAAHQSSMDNMETITDVTPASVVQAVAAAGVPRLIHGHTHRPARHAENGFERIVLGDWYEQGSVLIATPDGLSLETLNYEP